LTERERPEPESRPGFFLPAEIETEAIQTCSREKQFRYGSRDATFSRYCSEYLKMQYRGKHYIVVQGIEPDSWKWTVDLDEQTSKSGEAKTRGLAVSAVVLLVDSLLKQKSRPSAA
jgi:hypothetical protein